MPFLLVFCLGLAAIYALPEAKATPTMCEFIAVELFEAVDREDITHQDALDILDRCNKLEPPTSKH